MDAQIKKRRLHTIKHIPTVEDTHGDITQGEPIEHKAYKANKAKIIRSMAGLEVTSNIQFYIDGIVEFGAADLIQLSSGQKLKLLGYSNFDGLKPNTGTTVVYV